MSDDATLPAAQASLAAHFAGGSMSPALAIMLDPTMFERAKQLATYMSKAEGFTPGNLIGKPEACFAVVTRALTWKLDPFAVAQSTYQTPGGRVGYEGKLCQAILENSGKLEGPVRFEHYGDWSKVAGKFRIAKSQKGNDYAERTWTREDARGLGVRVKAKVRGETELREWPLDLEQCFPLNSTLWATDPKTQICYTAVRRFASVAAPGLMMGVPFDRDDWDDEVGRPDRAKDITPPARTGKTKLEAFVEAHAPSPEPEAQQHPDYENESQDAEPRHDPETGEVNDTPAELAPSSSAPQAPTSDAEKDRLGEDMFSGPAESPLPGPNDRVEILWPGEAKAIKMLAINAVNNYRNRAQGQSPEWRAECWEANPVLRRLLEAEAQS